MSFVGVAEWLDSLERNDLRRRMDLIDSAKFVGEDGREYVDMGKIMPLRFPIRTGDEKTA